MAFFLSNDVKQMLFMWWGKIYRLTISQLLTNISTHYLPTIAQVFDSFLSDTSAKYQPSLDPLPTSSGYRPSVDYLLCELSAKCQQGINAVSDWVRYWWTIKLCGLIYRYISTNISAKSPIDQLSTDIIIGWDYVHCIVMSRVDCTLLLPVYFQTDKLLNEILDSATSLLFELICVVHQVRSGLK